MSYVPGCEYDLFISYASEDNTDGWVEKLKDRLIVDLSDHFGRHFTKDSVFWAPETMRVAAGSFPEQLETAAKKSALFVPILSNAWLTSEWCGLERKAFGKWLPYKAEPSECLAAVRIKTLQKRWTHGDPIDMAQQFLFVDAKSQECPAAGSREWLVLAKNLAEQIEKALEALRHKCTPVFLGDASLGRAFELRASLRKELERRLFRTIPETFPQFAAAADAESLLREAALCVHFLGQSEETAREIMELSAKVCTAGTVIVQPFGTTLAGDENFWVGEFHDPFNHSSARVQSVSGKNDQEIVEILLQQLASLGKSTSVPDSRSGLGVVCDEPDVPKAQVLQKRITENSGLEVQYPSFLGRPTATKMELYRYWASFIRNRQGLLFLWGHSDAAKLERIWQLAEQEQPAGKRGWYLAAPRVNQKKKQRPDGIVETAPFKYASLRPFVESLLGSKKAKR